MLNNKNGVRGELRKEIKSVLLHNGYTIKHNPTLISAKPRNLLFLYYQSANYQSLRNNDILPLTLHQIEQYCQAGGHRFIFKQATYHTLDSMLDRSHQHRQYR